MLARALTARSGVRKATPFVGAPRNIRKGTALPVVQKDTQDGLPVTLHEFGGTGEEILLRLAVHGQSLLCVCRVDGLPGGPDRLKHAAYQVQPPDHPQMDDGVAALPGRQGLQDLDGRGGG